MGSTGFLGRIGKTPGKPKRVITLPNWLLKPAMAAVELGYCVKGKESGLAMAPFVELQTRNAFLDTDYSRAQLGYAKGDPDKALEDTVTKTRLEPDFRKVPDRISA